MIFLPLMEDLRSYLEGLRSEAASVEIAMFFNLEKGVGDDPIILITPNNTSYSIASRNYVKQDMLIDVWYIQSVANFSDVAMLSFIDGLIKQLLRHSFSGATVAEATTNLHLSEHSTKNLLVTQFTLRYVQHAGF